MEHTTMHAGIQRNRVLRSSIVFYDSICVGLPSKLETCNFYETMNPFQCNENNNITIVNVFQKEI